MRVPGGQEGKGYPIVILAAGRGSRLKKGDGEPKPLTRLLGLTLLERAVLSAREAGVEEFYVVVGYGKEEVISHIEEIERRHGLSIRVVENPHWEEENGTSVLAAREHLSGPFLLAMCDHVFDHQILRRLMEADDGTDTSLIAVDEELDRIFDLDEATKVRLEGERPVAIGKEVSPFDAVDTGLFLCKPPIFDALMEARKEGDSSLSAGIRNLIERGKIQAVKVGGHFWTDIDTPEDLEHAKGALLKGLGKKEEDGFISRYLNRPLSRKMTARLVDTSLTPNGISLLSFSVALLGAFLFGIGGYFWTLVAGLLVQLASIADGCDGEVARLKFSTSPYGGWMDTLLDRYSDGAIVAGITYGHWLSFPEASTWAWGVISLLGFLLVSYTKKEFSLRYGRKLPHDLWDKVSKRDLRLFGIFIGAILNRPFEAMALLGLLSHGVILRYLLSGYRKRQ